MLFYFMYFSRNQFPNGTGQLCTRQSFSDLLHGFMVMSAKKATAFSSHYSMRQILQTFVRDCSLNFRCHCTFMKLPRILKQFQGSREVRGRGRFGIWPYNTSIFILFIHSIDEQLLHVEGSLKQTRFFSFPLRWSFRVFPGCQDSYDLSECHCLCDLGTQTKVECTCTCSAMQCTLQLHWNYTACTPQFGLGRHKEPP